MPDCGWNPVCHAKNLVTSAAHSLFDDALNGLAKAVADAVGKAVAALGTLWVNVRTPDLASADGGTAGPVVGFLQGQLAWYVGAAAVLAVIVGGARMVWERRAQPGQDLLRGLLTLVVASAAGAGTIGFLVIASDGAAASILNSSLQGTQFGKNLTTVLGLSLAVGDLGPMLVVVLGVLALLATAIQIMLMVVRAGMLVILAGVLPLSASMTNTEAGRAWFRRSVSWAIAFALYKPAAAIVYAIAFQLAGTETAGHNGLVSLLTGLVLMIVALFALPALMRFVTPLVSSVAAGGAATAALAGAAAATLPTGAVSLGGMLGRGGASSAATAGGGLGGPSGKPGPFGGPGGGGSNGPSGAPPAGGGGPGPKGATPRPAGGDGKPGAGGAVGRPGGSADVATAPPAEGNGAAASREIARRAGGGAGQGVAAHRHDDREEGDR